MTNGQNTGSGPPASSPAGPSAGPIPRRLSYASVASGSNPQTYSNPSRSGTFSYLSGGYSLPNTSTMSHSQSEHRRNRTLSGHEPDVSTNGAVPFGSSWRKQAQLPHYSRQYASIPGFSYAGVISSSSFFIPSYLKGSRYVSKLEATHKKKLQSRRESTSAPSSNPPSLSTSASNVNVQRMAPSHRGMTYDIIESNPPKEEDQELPLPSRLSEGDKHPGLDLSQDGRTLKYTGPVTKNEMEATAVRADYPISPQCGLYYYEITINQKSSKEGMVALGFSTQKASLERLPGWETESWAYHGDDGRTFCGEGVGRLYADSFGARDIVGCGINFLTGHAFFTKNGIFLNTAFRDLKDLRAFPAIGLKRFPGTVLTVNFGQEPFVFDIDNYVAEQRKIVQSQIAGASVSSLHPQHDEGNLLQELVAHFLSHDGYVETAKAFATEAKKQKQALVNAPTEGMDSPEPEDDMQAVNRQNIRTAILDGDVDRALKHTRAYFPKALDDNPQIVFRLKCRKWVELIRRSNDLGKAHSGRNRASSTNTIGQPGSRNGYSNNDDSVFAQDMELDDWEKMEADDADRSVQSQKLQMEAIEYGSELNREYGNASLGHGHDREQRSQYRRVLDDIFSLIAYDDAKASVHGHLLDPNGRVAVAEELNSAILVSLGRSPSAALEKLYRQTEALVDELSRDGGPAAFLNLHTLLDDRPGDQVLT